MARSAALICCKPSGCAHLGTGLRVTRVCFSPRRTSVKAAAGSRARACSTSAAREFRFLHVSPSTCQGQPSFHLSPPDGCVSLMANAKSRRAPLSGLPCRLFILFGEASVPMFCPFFYNGLVCFLIVKFCAFFSCSGDSLCQV